MNLQNFEVAINKILERAHKVALALNAEDLIIKSKDIILAYESQIAVDEKAGLWGFSFDLLLSNKRIQLSKEEQSGILKALEDRLDRLSSSSEGSPSDPRGSEAVVERLARYYRAQSRLEESKRVLNKLQTSFENAAKDAAPLVAISFFERLHAIYIQFNLNGEAQAIAAKIRQIGPDVNKEMKAILIYPVRHHFSS
jgi:hypothetical protein